MYKLLLCWRYLKTRYLAFACIISVMLGVATLLVVNSVMNGFSSKLRDLLHNIMSDVVVESAGFDGFHDPVGKMQKIRQDSYLSEQIEEMAVTLEAFAMIQFRHRNGEIATRPVRVIGVDPKQRSLVGGFKENLFYQHNSPNPSFDIPEEVRLRHERQEWALKLERDREQNKFNPDGIPPPTPVPFMPRIPKGAIVGHLIAHFNTRDEHGQVKEYCALEKGDQIVLTTVSGQRLTPVYDSFVVVDYFKSGMSDVDGNCIMVPLEHLQLLRNMDNRATNILIKLKNYSKAQNVRNALAKLFEGEYLAVNTWEDKQGPLLKAIEIEKGILNVLLFMIIAVAGFGILSIFSMIVAEKTRDIGILKALGASNKGVMNIFLSYGLLLGIVGALLGTILGLSITFNINEVEHLISLLTGSKVFTGEVYYFKEIPTDVQPIAVLIVNLGAIAIAVVFSLIPALRAATLHPVQALRYE
jgi:lipoprotein-releasing system permease protein